MEHLEKLKIIDEQVLPCLQCTGIYDLKITKTTAGLDKWFITCKCSTKSVIGIGNTLSEVIYNLNCQNQRYP